MTRLVKLLFYGLLFRSAENSCPCRTEAAVPWAQRGASASGRGPRSPLRRLRSPAQPRAASCGVLIFCPSRSLLNEFLHAALLPKGAKMLRQVRVFVDLPGEGSMEATFPIRVGHHELRIVGPPAQGLIDGVACSSNLYTPPRSTARGATFRQQQTNSEKLVPGSVPRISADNLP